MYKDVRFDVKVLKRFCLIIFLIDYSTSRLVETLTYVNVICTYWVMCYS